MDDVAAETVAIPFRFSRGCTSWTRNWGKCTTGNHAGTHQGALAYGYDFYLPLGTPVVAVRDGVCVHAVDCFHEGGQRPELRTRSNFVALLHPGDGGGSCSGRAAFFSRYFHLQPGSVQVRPGQAVTTGQVLGLSGNTGYSSGPHLHFDLVACVPEVAAELELEWVPPPIPAAVEQRELPPGWQGMPGVALVPSAEIRDGGAGGGSGEKSGCAGRGPAGQPVRLRIPQSAASFCGPLPPDWQFWPLELCAPLDCEKAPENDLAGRAVLVDRGWADARSSFWQKTEICAGAGAACILVVNTPYGLPRRSLSDWASEEDARWEAAEALDRAPDLLSMAGSTRLAPLPVLMIPFAAGLATLRCLRQGWKCWVRLRANPLHPPPDIRGRDLPVDERLYFAQTLPVRFADPESLAATPREDHPVVVEGKGPLPSQRMRPAPPLASVGGPQQLVTTAPPDCRPPKLQPEQGAECFSVLPGRRYHHDYHGPLAGCCDGALCCCPAPDREYRGGPPVSSPSGSRCVIL